MLAESEKRQIAVSFRAAAVPRPATQLAGTHSLTQAAVKYRGGGYCLPDEKRLGKSLT